MMPRRSSDEAAGFDLFASHEIKIAARSRALAETHIKIKLPAGTYGRIAARSSAAWKRGIIIGAGVIDRDFDGTIKILAFNTTDEEIYIAYGVSIAQLILEKIVYAELCVENAEPSPSEKLPPRHRDGGFREDK